MKMVLNNEFCDMTQDEMEMFNGGKWYDAALTFAGGVATTVGAAGLASGSGSAIASMGVASLAACGPAGWAVIGIGVVGGVATGAATLAAARK